MQNLMKMCVWQEEEKCVRAHEDGYFILSKQAFF